MAELGAQRAQAEVFLLGPMVLAVDGVAVDVPGPKRRALLALLAAAENRAVPVDDLLAALWPAHLPNSARASLQSHISRLRGHLGPAAARLEGLPDAYRLSLGASGTDVGRARLLVSDAAGSDPAVAVALLGEARTLWRGEPLAEFADVAPLSALAVTLIELRHTIEEAYGDAALGAGRVDEAIEAGRANAAAQPLSEPAALLLMRALEAKGRSADALRAGYEFRRRLATEAGLEPTPALGRLEAEIASVTTLRPGQLHRPMRPLRGRDSERAALRRLLVSERLVTVLGPGGVGKTHLATSVAADTEPVTALLLGSVTDGAAVPQALAAALDLRVARGDALHACAALLAAGPHLLLIDNCEHLLVTVSEVVATLLDAAPTLTILATSREPLGLSVEQRLRVGPLAMTRPTDLDDLARAPAVAMFIDRARGVNPDFSPGANDLGLITEIVHRLDGMPLAIELAAGRLASLGLVDLHGRLDQAMDVLAAGDVSLRQTISWSYNLLPDDERRLLRHLSVFPDGVDLTTAEAVAGDLGLGRRAIPTLAHLVDASIVEASAEPTVRYRLLDTVRSFAQTELENEGEHEAAVERFLGWAAERAMWIGQAIDTDDEVHADEVLRREFANLRAAWVLVRKRGRLDEAMKLVIGVCDAAGWRDLTEVRDWALELAADPAINQHPDASLVVALAADSAWARGDLDAADSLAQRGLDIGGKDSWRCVASQALVALSRGDLSAAIVHGTSAADQATRPEPSFGIAALAAAYLGDLTKAAELNERLRSVAASPTLVAMQAYVAGEIDALSGATEASAHHYERAIDLARSTGATFVEGIASVGLLTTDVRAGHITEALVGYGNLIDYWERTGGWVQQWTTLRNLADLLSKLGDYWPAAFLTEAADRAVDAPPVSEIDHAVRGDDLDADQRAVITLEARAASRSRILDVARRAIAARLSDLDRTATG